MNNYINLQAEIYGKLMLIEKELADVSSGSIRY